MSIQAKTKYQRMRCRGCGSKELEDSSDSPWWLPGIVVVEFEQPLSPDQIFPSTDSISETDVPCLDVEKFKEIVGNRWVKPPRRTFPSDDGPILPNLKRFLTLYLQPDVNVPQVAKALSELRGVKRAAGEPRLTPPIQRIPMSEPIESVHSETLSEAALLGEPLAVPGGNPRGLSVFVGQATPRFKNQWYLFRSKADQILNTGVNGAGVVVADIDWGFKDDHQEFDKKITFKYNAETTGDIVSSGPRKWHGTATLGLIGAGDNNMGMLGFAAGAELWAIKAQHDGSVDNDNWRDAIEKVWRRPSGNKPKVILVEASTGPHNVEVSEVVRGAIMQAIAAGCVVVAPAGNGGMDAGFFESAPLPSSGCILVGATQHTDPPSEILPGFSNFGARIDVSAPGAIDTDVTCCACSSNTYTDNFGGTSGAAAKVAGALALVLQQYPEATHQQIVRAFATMQSIPAVAGREIGCFLDVPELLTRVEGVLAEDA